MSIIKKLLDQGSRPQGLLGVIVGKLMNLFHVKKYLKGLGTLKIESDWICLDIGCGGGKPARKLADLASSGKVYGLDHSEEMITLAAEVNGDFIAHGRMDFVHGSVSELPFVEGYFDLVTASETVQFWPDLENDLSQVRRVLKPGGVFLIMNRFPEESQEKWMKHLQIKNENHYRKLLSEAGFAELKVETGLMKNWILIQAK